MTSASSFGGRMKLGIFGCGVEKNAWSDISVVLRMFATA
jgi:hypothetical protein